MSIRKWWRLIKLFNAIKKAAKNPEILKSEKFWITIVLGICAFLTWYFDPEIIKGIQEMLIEIVEAIF